MSFPPFRSTVLARPAAVIALLAVLVIAFALVNTLVQSYSDLVAVVLLLAIVAACAWFALTRSGARRWFVVPPGVLALVNLVAVLADHVLFLLLLITMMTLFGATARHAVRHKAPARIVTRHAQPAQRALGGVLIINPRSGGGKAERFDLATEAKKRGVEPVMLERGSDLGELAERACSGGADVIGMAGGGGVPAPPPRGAMQDGVAPPGAAAGARHPLAPHPGLDPDDVVGAPH